MIYITNDEFLNSTGTFNANSPLIGWHSILRPQDIDANTAPVSPGLGAVNMWSPDTSTYYQSPPIVAGFGLAVFLSNPSAQIFDYIGIARHNLGSTGYTFRIEVTFNAGMSWSEIVSPRIHATDNAIMYYFNPTAAPLVRIVMLNNTPGTIPGPIIAHIKMGRIMALQRRIYVGHAPATLAKNVRKIVNISESGQYLGQEILRSYRKTSIQQQHNTPDFVREHVVPFIDHVNGHRINNNTAPATFFFAWRPTDYPAEVIYGWTNDNIQPTNQLSNGMMSWSVDVDAIA